MNVHYFPNAPRSLNIRTLDKISQNYALLFLESNICLQRDSNKKHLAKQAGALDRSVTLAVNELCLKV